MSFSIGVILVTLGGILEGLFSIPVTKVKSWQFENIWGIGSLFALLLLPWPLASLYVEDLSQLYSSIPSTVLIGVILSGVAWGIGGIYWGRAIAAMGMALGVSILMGLINIFGSIVPLSVFEPSQLATKGGYILIIAVTTMILGVVIMSVAAKQKETVLLSKDKSTTRSHVKGSFKSGILFCIISGILSAGVNFAFIFGAPITDEAIAMHVPEYATSFALWSLVFTANFFINTVYGFYMMVKKGTLKNLKKGSLTIEWLGALFMGLAWPGGIIIYGIGANAMGDYGAYAGFPMMILASILTGNLAGALGGEWKNSGSKPRRIMLYGVFTLCIAFILLGYSTYVMNG
ncbi:L-rhamnose/proton symporter RhaT [Flagellimonas marina]|uniref:L-rhamnose/proton symporter RhaT n=1 Tax=Flagellimonas marina TaxID=1775168 RepID=A0ABV8PJ13_9FLAO